MEIKVNESIIRLQRGDITDMEIEAFVYYAQHDLALGSGYGGAIAVRGGPSVQKEIKDQGPLKTCEALVSGAGKMKSEYIIHAVGPRFQEEDEERKLRDTILNVFKKAEEKGIKKIAFPPMGAGFYCVPLDVCSRVMLQTFKDYLQNSSNIEEVVVVALDSREYKPFEPYFNSQ